MKPTQRAGCSSQNAVGGIGATAESSGPARKSTQRGAPTNAAIEKEKDDRLYSDCA